MVSSDEDPPFDGGAQPVRERPAEVPSAGRSVGQTLVIVLAVLVVLAGLIYVFVRLGG